MALDFSKNTNNYLSLGANAVGPLVDGAESVSIHLWLTADGLDPTPTFGEIKNCLFATFAGTSAEYTLATIFVSGQDQLTFVTAPPGAFVYGLLTAEGIALDELYAFGATLDIAGKQLRLYLNGQLSASTSLFIFVSSYNHVAAPVGSPDSIGSRGIPANSDQQWDGMLSEVSLFDRDIGDEGFAALAAGCDPLTIDPPPVFYLDLGRFGTRCPLSGVEGQVVGTIGQREHPPIAYAPLRAGSAFDYLPAQGGPYEVERQTAHLAGARPGEIVVSGSQAGANVVAGSELGLPHLAAAVAGEPFHSGIEVGRTAC